ncbi:MAG: hypothetical protein JO250_18025 [Armatimonadetes bacterium]|nr:hypothetical protein [Armatimonadota bacterium]
MAANEISAGLAEKVNEYRVMTAPLEQAIRELEYAQTLLKARAESDIAQTVPALGALADILDISTLDLLMAPDRLAFVHAAMDSQGLTPDEVAQQMRALVASPQSRDDLKALGIGEQIA